MIIKFIFVHLRYINALFIRVFLIILSEILLKYNIVYTDIDYYVFTDGAKHMLSLESPFNRETYRYTPLLSLLMIPNHLIHISYGKFFFIIVDILNGLCIEILLNLQNYFRIKKLEERQKKSSKPKFNPNNKTPIENILNTFSDNNSMNASSEYNNINNVLNSDNNSINSNSNNSNNTNNNVSENDILMEKLKYVFDLLKKLIDNPFATTSLFYLYNPFVINISTRGSADCLIILFILLTLIFIELEIYSLAGIFYGLAVHFKIYPVVYGPAILLYIISKKINFFNSFLSNINKKEDVDANGEVTEDRHGNRNNSEEAPSFIGHTRNQQPKSISKIFPFNLLIRYIHFVKQFFTFRFYWGIFTFFISKIKNFLIAIFTQIKNLFYLIFRYVLNIHAITFFGFMLITFAYLFCVFYLLYGQKFVYEYLLYHVVRKDHRHNYSLFSYLMYLIYTSNFGKILSLLAFLPQVVLIFFSSIFLFKDLNLCLITTTWIFVTFNKVVTAQYYLWYLALLPLIVPYNKMFNTKKIKCLVLFALWLYFEVYWNSLSHDLEYKGENKFYKIWILNIVFFLINCIIIKEVVSDNESLKIIKVD